VLAQSAPHASRAGRWGHDEPLRPPCLLPSKPPLAHARATVLQLLAEPPNRHGRFTLASGARARDQLITASRWPQRSGLGALRLLMVSRWDGASRWPADWPIAVVGCGWPPWRTSLDADRGKQPRPSRAWLGSLRARQRITGLKTCHHGRSSSSGDRWPAGSGERLRSRS